MMRALLARVAAVVRAACGVPSYEAYVAHLRMHHPDRAVPSRAAFFRERQVARYRRGSSRCC
jgi:uncharacterized short protein YbdD (DUF466 family)